MSSVLEIEKAIESLPTSEMLEVAEWLDAQRAMTAAAEESGDATIPSRQIRVWLPPSYSCLS